VIQSNADILEEAARLIEPQGAWVKGYYALNSRGIEADTAEEAVCYCALGAISVAAGGNPPDEMGSRAQELLHTVISGPIDKWNDAPERTQEEVVAKLHEAAAKAREAGL